MSIHPGQFPCPLPGPLPSEQGFAPQGAPLIRQNVLGPQGICPNFLSPRLTSLCFHSCSRPSPGTCHSRDFLHPIPGLHCLLFPPFGPFSTLHPLLCTRPLHRHGNTFTLLPYPTPSLQAGVSGGGVSRTPELRQATPGTKPPASFSSF